MTQAKALTDLSKKKNMNDLALPSLIKKILNTLKKNEVLNF